MLSCTAIYLRESTCPRASAYFAGCRSSPSSTTARFHFPRRFALPSVPLYSRDAVHCSPAGAGSSCSRSTPRQRRRPSHRPAAQHCQRCFDFREISFSFNHLRLLPRTGSFRLCHLVQARHGSPCHRAMGQGEGGIPRGVGCQGVGPGPPAACQATRQARRV